MKTALVSLSIVVVFAFAAFAEEGTGMSSSQSDIALEVQKLRVAIENMAAANYRAQMIFERIKVQNDQIMLVRNLIDKITDDISNGELSMAQSAEQLSSLQSRLEMIREESQQTSYREEMAQLKKQVEHQDRQVRNKKEKLMFLENELNDLMRKHGDLVSRLDSLDYDLKSAR